jgi:hypothetical protein
MGSSFKALDIRLHPLPSAAIALPGGHAALAFMNVGAGFVDRAAIQRVKIVINDNPIEQVSELKYLGNLYRTEKVI